MDYFLKQVEPGNPYPLQISLQGDEIKIGRSTITSLARYNRVSRYHASFTKRSDSWFITDLKSLNYLYVNLERIQHTVQLNVGDIIGFGSPNVSQDGGFVCVLAVRNKVVVKQEIFDDECVEIPIDSTYSVSAKNSNCNTVKSISRQHTRVKTDESEVPNFNSSSTNLALISYENPKICKPESTFNFCQNIKVHSKVQSYPIAYNNLNPGERAISKVIGHNDGHFHVHPTHINTQSSRISAYPGIEYIKGLEELRSCEISTSTVTCKDKDLEKCDAADTSALLNFNLVKDPNINPHLNSEIVKKEVYSEDFITHLSENRKVETIKGVEYLGLEKLKSCEIAKSTVTSKETELEKCGDSDTRALLNFNYVQDPNIKAPLNSDIVKKEVYSEDFITYSSETPDNSMKSIHSATFENCESNNDQIVKNSIVMTDHFPKDCTPSSFGQTCNIPLLNDIVKSNKNSVPISSIPFQDLNTESFIENTNEVNNFVKNISNSYEENAFNGDFEKMNESTKACLMKQHKVYTKKQTYDRLEIDKDLTKTTELKTFTINNMKTHDQHMSETIRDIQLVKCDSNNPQMSLNTAKWKSSEMCASKQDLFDENSSDLFRVSNCMEVSSTLKDNATSQAKKNDLTVAINVRVRKNKILSSESDCEEKNELFLHSPKSFTTASRHKRKKEKHDKDNHVSKRNKTKDGEFCLSSYSEISQLSGSKETNKSDKTPISSHFVHSKRLYSESDNSDGYSRSRSPVNEKSCGISNETRSKSLRRTVLIDFKPMEYRSRHLRGREEWFQERCGAMDVENVTQTLTSRQEDKTVKLAVEYPEKRKLKSCCQKRRENKRLKDSFKKSEKIHSQKRADISQKIAEKNSRENMEIDSVRKRAMPPVPKRKNNFCSRMGFLLDTQVECDKKSIDKRKQQEKLRNTMQNPSKHRATMSSGSKLHFDLSLELDLSKDEKQTPTYETASVKRNSTKTSTNSVNDISTSTVQHSNYEHSKLSSDKHKTENRILNLELDSKRKNDDQSKECVESSVSDIFSDSNTNKIPKKIYQCKDINGPTNSMKVVTVSHDQQIDNETTKCHRNARISQHFHVSPTSLMEMIVSWNPKWLVEQKNNKNPPPLIAQGASFLNLSFSSYETYASSYFPMIVLEVWECLFRECTPHLVLNQLQNCNNFCYTIKTWENRDGVTELKCESVVSDVLCYHPTEGKIVLLNVKDRQELGMENCTFGCIYRHSIEEFKPAHEWANIPMDALNNAKLVKFKVVIKKSKRPAQLKSVYLAQGLSNIKQKLQLADALRSFRNSPLCKDICYPREETLMFCDSSRGTLSSVNLIQAISEEVHNPVSKAKVLLLQAPPGTGKTRCVVELVKQLAVGNSTKTKVLMCAPSYTALDEILCGLVQSNVNCRNSSSADFLKFVILDEHEGMSSNMKEYSLSGKVIKLYKEDCVKKMHKRECAIKLLEEKINEMLFKQQTSQDMYRKINKDTTIKALVDKLQTLKCKNLLHHMDEGYRKGYEFIVLQESDVLLSLLESSMLPAVRTFLRGKSVVCVVDEAAQCNELQLLQCLHNEKIGKLVLFGDPQQQQPTTISKWAAKCGFDRSIFDRFFIHHKQKFHKIPCPTFKKQYRMHSEICQFPSAYFYNQELTTKEGTDKGYAHFPLKPYTVLDVLDPGPIPDDTESSLVVYICSLLTQVCPAASIGIIVGDEDKKHGMSLPWDTEYSTVEMNTVEGFQGREKDIILIPCIRQSSMLNGESPISCGRRLNVALTRAKQCLIICGQVASHVQYPHWKALMDDALARNCYLCVASVTHLPLVFGNYIKKV